VRQIVAVTGKSVLGVRPTDGKVLWSYPWLTSFDGNIATPHVVGDYVFVSSGYNKGCALLRVTADGEGAKATEVYYRKNRVMRNHHSTCVHHDGFLYGFDDNELRCVDLRKGTTVPDWDARDAGNKAVVKGAVIRTDKHLVGLTQVGTLFLADLDPKEFRLRGEVKGVLEGIDCWALPVLVDGRLYLRDHEKVVCLDVK
jgi:outer membrane protein assembly factor BamB